jgi:hypothetical protein
MARNGLKTVIYKGTFISNRSLSKAKGVWEWSLKVSGPLDYFRIEPQNFTGFWSIYQLFIGFGRKSLIVSTVNL